MSRETRRLLVVLAVLVPLGFATKLYSGPAESWVQGHAGGLLYVLFWCLLVLAVRPHLSPWAVGTAVLGVTSALEFLQLWQSPLLERVRSTFFGHAMIGSSFSWLDFPYYVAGALLSVAVVRLLWGSRSRRAAA